MVNKCPTCGFGLSAKTPESDCLNCNSKKAPTPTASENDDSPDRTMTIDSHRRMDELNLSEYPALNPAEQHLDAIDRYELTDVLGDGGMGRVLHAQDHNLERSVALKLLHAPHRKNHELLDRFIEEARVTGQLQHPNIIPLHDLSFDEQGNPFYTMKEVRGHTLRDILNGLRSEDSEVVKQYPISRLLTIFMKICDAVAYAHSRGVLHRDLKPENVMVGDYGEVVVMDWGLAKVLNKPHRPSPSSTQHWVDSNKALETQYGRLIGTPQYMSPEQAAGNNSKISTRSDIYTLGVILFEILTLSPAFSSEAIDDVLADVISGNVNDVLSVRSTKAHYGDAHPLPHIPQKRVHESLAAVVRKAMENDPRRRYPDVRSLQDEIEAFQNGFATEAEQAGFFRQAQLLIQRNKLLTTFLALIGILLITASVVFYNQRGEAVKALQDLKQETELRQQEQRDSAPGFYQSALEHAKNGRLTQALQELEFSISYDPRMSKGHWLQAIIHILDKEYDAAASSVNAYLEIEPHDPDMRKLKDWLDAPDPELNLSLPEFADMVNRKGIQYTRLAAQLLHNNYQGLEQLHKNLDMYRNLIKQAEPNKKLEEALAVNQRTGLNFTHLNATHLGRLDNLNMLRDIPLNDLEVSVLNTLDLSPLEGMPLRRLIAWDQVEARSLEGLRGHTNLTTLAIKGDFTDLTPLRGKDFSTLKLEGAFTDFTALEGMNLDFLHLDGHYVDVQTLNKMKFESLALLTKENFQNLEFLHHHPELKNLKLRKFPINQDFTPLLTNTNLVNFEEDFHLREMTTFGRYSGMIYIDAVNHLAANRLEAARASIENLTSKIENPALGYIEETGYIMLHLIERRLDPTHRIPSSSFTTVVGEKTFIWLPTRTNIKRLKIIADNLNLRIACIANEVENKAIATMLTRPARGGNYKVDAAIGAYRDKLSEGWAWEDESPWNFTFWKVFNEGYVGRAYIRNDGEWEVHAGEWFTTAVFEIPTPPPEPTPQNP